MIDETDFELKCAEPCAEPHCREHGSELRDARDLIVQLQRELERAREVIAEQRTIVRAVTCVRGHQ